MSIFAPSTTSLESTPAESPKVETPASPTTPVANQATEIPGTPAAETPAADAATEQQTPKPSRAAERISQIYAQKKSAETQRDYAFAEVQRLREELEKRPQVAADDFAGQEEERLRRVVKTERLDQTVTDANRAHQQVVAARDATFSAKIDAARDRIPDLGPALETFFQLPLSNVAADFIVDSDKAAEIAYYLAKNPNEAVHIARLRPIDQGIALARIESRVTASPPKRLSQAPAPVQTVSGGVAGNASADLGSMAFADYEKARTAQMQARGR